VVEAGEKADGYSPAESSAHHRTPHPALRADLRDAISANNMSVDSQLTNRTTEYKKDLEKWVMMPVFAKKRRTSLDARISEVVKFAETSEINKIEIRDKKIGVISSGISYENVREALPEASTLKLGMTYPLSQNLIEEFAAKVDNLYVVEEGSDYLSTLVKSMGFDLADYPGALPLPKEGEITPSLIRQSFGVELSPVNYVYGGEIPSRPPALCPGCPHRVVFAELAFMRAIVTGDIGCYTLAALPSLSAMDSCVDMGASISMAHGVELAKNPDDSAQDTNKSRPVVAVIGDSTFAHSGITSLLGTIYNQGSGIVCILDNRTTAMTGQQGNPLNGISLQGRPSRELDLIALLKGLGIENPQEIDPMNRNAVRVALKDAAKSDELSVLIFKSPCYLIHRNAQKPYTVTGDCRACGNCSRIACPAIGLDEEKKAVIDANMCVGCGQCKQYCSFGSIVQDLW
jgi:indolepyruvate ferredoxin oxidoreductase alpha subunit